MSDETTVGREPIQIVEVEQPQCALTYGVSPCVAAVGTTGTHKCFNTRASCQDPDNYDGSDVIVWRFAKPSRAMPTSLYDDGTSGYVKTNAIPSLVSVTTSPSRINVGGGSEDSSPLGRRASVAIALKDHLWDDSVEDKYVSEREYDPMGRGTFWSKWQARNPYHARYPVHVIEGYVGQDIGDMQRRTYVLDRVAGPSGTDGAVTITAKDPLGLADGKRTQFPAVSSIALVGAIDSSPLTTSIEVTCIETELTDDYGNTGSTRYLRIGDEIMEYTGYSNTGTLEWTLSGVARGALGTTAAAHAADDKCQRVGRYEDLEVWNIAADLLTNHTSIDPAFVDTAQWDDEGNAYLTPFTLTATVAKPTPVVTLLGELTEQCPFYVWWDEREQTIPLKAVRPPMADGVTAINDTQHIIEGSVAISEDPNQRISRIFLYYRQRDPTKSLGDVGNYDSVRARIEADAESDAEHGDVRVRQVFSRWLDTAAQAIHTTSRLIARFRDTVKMLSFKVDAKDRSISTADVLEVTTSAVVDETGEALPLRWQVIAAEEIVAGERVRFDCLRFEFMGRFWIWADEGAQITTSRPIPRRMRTPTIPTTRGRQATENSGISGSEQWSPGHLHSTPTWRPESPASRARSRPFATCPRPWPSAPVAPRGSMGSGPWSSSKGLAPSWAPASGRSSGHGPCRTASTGSAQRSWVVAAPAGPGQPSRGRQSCAVAVAVAAPA